MPSKPKKRPPKPGAIYFITDGTDFVKIGSTAGNVRERIANLQVANPRRLELIDTIECEDVRAVERQIHNRFFDRLHTGEWFRLSRQEAAHFVRVYKHYKQTDLMSATSLAIAVPKLHDAQTPRKQAQNARDAQKSPIFIGRNEL
jgi:hypothetical protein